MRKLYKIFIIESFLDGVEWTELQHIAKSMLKSKMKIDDVNKLWTNIVERYKGTRQFSYDKITMLDIIKFSKDEKVK